MTSEPLTFVTWFWNEPDHPGRFKPHYVNVLRAMIARHYHKPHRLVCVTNTPDGIDSRVEIVNAPNFFAHLKNPRGDRFPSCYRRLWNFSADAAAVFGPRIVALDIDVIIVNDLTDMLDRPGDFIPWTDSRKTWKNKIAGGLYLLRTGTHTQVWDRFDPIRSPTQAQSCGVSGSDQGWMSYVLYPPKTSFTVDDGVMSLKWIDRRQGLPRHTRIISTPGRNKPWTPAAQEEHPWIKKHWKE